MPPLAANPPASDRVPFDKGTLYIPDSRETARRSPQARETGADKPVAVSSMAVASAACAEASPAMPRTGSADSLTPNAHHCLAGRFFSISFRPCSARAAPIAVSTFLTSSGGGNTAGMPSDAIHNSRVQPLV